MRQKLWLLLILALAAFLRLQNINWDGGHYLHPDERFLAMVASAMHLPTSLAQYLDPASSPFNPANIGYKFYVYGLLPVSVAKLTAIFMQADTYGHFSSIARVLSGLADLLVVVVVYKILELFEKRYRWNGAIKYYGAFLYAISVLPIQLSHFFTVDTFLNFFMVTSFYFSLKYALLDPASRVENRAKGQPKSHIGVLILSAIFLGLAIASKITAFLILPLNLYFLFFTILSRSYQGGRLIEVIKRLTIYILIAYATVRLADPYLFQSANLLDPTPSHLFVTNIAQLKALSDPNGWFPPGIQWISKTPVLFSLENLMLWGLGPVQFLLVLVGVGWILKQQTVISKPLKVKYSEILVILGWVIGYFIYQGAQFAQTMRYFLPLYPFFALFGAFGLEKILNFQFSILNSQFKRILFNMTFFMILLLWPLAFTSIYFRPHSRVAASQWIYQNIDETSLILSEHWDDALPLSLSGETKRYVIKELPVFGQDTAQKWSEMEALFEGGDYYILSSNRVWGSIMAVPQKYPIQAKFYEDLFAGRTRWHKVAEFTSYPSLGIGNWLAPRSLGEVGELDIPDDSSDESFTVYDHPKVMIFKKAIR